MSARAHRLLGGAAAALGLLAAATAFRPSDRGAVDVVRLARTVEREEDHVTAIELAAWIRDRKPGLRVVDVRPDSDFQAYHLPTAENLSLSTVVKAPFRSDETVVLVSEGGTHAAQGWFLLRARGLEHVYFLREGVYEWLTRVMDPTLPAGASPEQRASFDSVAALSRYFGGQPHVAASPTPGSTAAGAAIHLSGDGGAAVDDPAAALPGAGSAAGGTAAAVRRVRARGC
jgi:rhodanese-related sulfurtransferase